MNYLGKEKLKNSRGSYSRQLIANRIHHNNRSDNIRILLYKDQLLSKRISEKSSYLYISDNFNKEIKFDPEEKVDLKSFEIIELLGKGSFGEVYLVELIKNMNKYAMKVLNKQKIFSQNLIRYIITERNILSNIRHPYIVELYYAFQTDDYLYLIMEYCEGRDLSYHLNKQTKFKEDNVRIIIAQLLLAIEELHKHGVIYR